MFQLVFGTIRCQSPNIDTSPDVKASGDGEARSQSMASAMGCLVEAGLLEGFCLGSQLKKGKGWFGKTVSPDRKL